MPPNPIGGIIDGLGGAAASIAGEAFDAAMKAIWTFATSLLTGVLTVIDKYMAPNLDPVKGPLAGLMPAALWLGGVVAVVMAFVQIGRSVMAGGRGFARLGIGFGQYVVATVAGLGILATSVAASDSLARDILMTGLGIDSWAGINDKNSILQNTVNGVSGVGLGLIALLCVIPAALGYVVEALVRDAGILILGGTIPILAGGLLSDATRRWFWTGLRWVIALVLFTPTVAFTVTLGMRLAEGAAGANGSQQDATQAAVGAVVAGMVLIISLACPLAMFKLFAWVDPNTLSGASVRGFFAGRGAGSAGGAPASDTSEPAAEADTDSRFGQIMAGLGALDVAGMGARGANLAAAGSSMLDAMGAGHRGGPRPVDSGQSSADGGGDDDQAQAAGGGPGPDGGEGPEPAGGDGPAAMAAAEPVSAVGAMASGRDVGAPTATPSEPASPPDAGGSLGAGGGEAAAGGDAAAAAVIV